MESLHNEPVAFPGHGQWDEDLQVVHTEALYDIWENREELRRLGQEIAKTKPVSLRLEGVEVGR